MNSKKQRLDTDDLLAAERLGKAKRGDVRRTTLGLIIFALATYGTATLLWKVYDHFFWNKEVPVMLSTSLGQPGHPNVIPNLYDFSDMDETFKGIERQLERMNDIQLKIQQEGR